MVWNMHARFERSSSGFLAMEGKGCSCYGAMTEGWLYSANPTGRVEVQDISQWQQLTFFAFMAGLTLPSILCFCLAPFAMDCDITCPLSALACGHITLGMTSWNTQWTYPEKESVQIKLKSLLCIFLQEIKQFWGRKDSYIPIAHI